MMILLYSLRTRYELVAKLECLLLDIAVCCSSVACLYSRASKAGILAHKAAKLITILRRIEFIGRQPFWSVKYSPDSAIPAHTEFRVSIKVI